MWALELLGKGYFILLAGVALMFVVVFLWPMGDGVYPTPEEKRQWEAEQLKKAAKEIRLRRAAKAVSNSPR